MTTLRQYKLPPQTVMALAADILRKAIVDNNRAAAKRLFNSLEEGRALSMARMNLQGNVPVEFGLALDTSEHRGRLAFSVFRQSVAVLSNVFEKMVQEGQEPQVFGDDQTGNFLLFVPVVHESEDGQRNVLVLGVERPTSAGILFRLQYLDPEQFQGSATQAG